VIAVAGKRVLFTIMPADQEDQLFACVSEAPFKVKPIPRPLKLAAPQGDLDTEANIATYGASIRDALMGHPEISSVLDSVFKAPAAESWNLLFGISSEPGEAIRWEVVQTAASDYFVLKGSRRLFRVASDNGSPALELRALPEVLRFVAFLSPAQVDSTAEYKGLVAAATAAREAGVPVDLMVFVGQRSLLQPDLTAPPWLTVKPMPDTTLDMQFQLQELQPHILHFFCHGIVEQPQSPVAQPQSLVTEPQSLELATVGEQRIDAERGSVLFSMDRLIKAHVLEQAWTVVFNCCDGGRPGKALNSMAYRAVVRGGVPAAIGMGSPLPVGAAPHFSSAFYRTLFHVLASLLATADAAVEIDFGEPIAEARRGLHEAIKAAGLPFACWSLPIIYLHPKPFVVQKSVRAAAVAKPAAPPPAAPQGAPAAMVDSLAIATRIRTVAGMLQIMPPTTPIEVRREMLALFDQPPYVPPELRCDENGLFRKANGAS